ncbi:TlpA disulfide reductase family protein [Cocleimonas sp. KMM 6892]|uniref:TlpA disulfide reductase family protein n=1 Tax=unclassified Cocleimonas TaxID=2639732 RepID=UPI002DBDB60F|nr:MULTISPECIES: TlpA disulfide reductase family protein [unclassified Cocleimonas]MEB8433131.1 TlpA disulfide reductase family protein [Cocleimonas sp. KMM 6892]MEC4715888.1 TlpA disulfide reductase family protein [Cocleimonas sp. KMM 6895]MEC4745349.1 TlpA disulfide reductase family protein [Cocleimonas sp. KMM 6896]
MFERRQVKAKSGISLTRLAIPLLIIMTLTTVNGVSADEKSLIQKLTPVKQSIMAPALKLQDMDEETTDLKDLKGKTVVVNFWATWCPPCRKEMASLGRLHQSTKDKNVEVLAVDIGEDDDAVFAFMAELDPTPEFTVLFNEDGSLMKSWKVRGLPTTFIINPKGEIAYFAIGGRNFDDPEIIKAITDLNSSTHKT